MNIEDEESSRTAMNTFILVHEKSRVVDAETFIDVSRLVGRDSTYSLMTMWHPLPFNGKSQRAAQDAGVLVRYWLIVRIRPRYHFAIIFTMTLPNLILPHSEPRM